MKQFIFKRAFIVAVSVCMVGMLFTTLSSTGKAYAATTHVTRAAINCPGITYYRGYSFYPGEADSTTACSGRTLVLTFQANDGNFVLYCRGYSAIWATNTNDNDIQDFPPVDVAFQADGNLVVYIYVVGLGETQAFWASGTNGEGATKLVLQGDGNLVIYKGTQALWASNTSGRC